MGLLFADRSRRGPDPYLDWKVRLFLAGAVVALVGMARESSWIVGVAVALLAAGFLLRFVPAADEERDGEGAGDQASHEREADEPPPSA